MRIREERLELEEPLVLAGDFNVIPAAADVHNPPAWVNDALFLPDHARSFPVAAGPRADRRAARRSPTRPANTRSGTIRPAPGRRTTACASIICCCRRRPATGSTDVGIDSYVRAWEKPSDHVPVWVDLDLETA